MKKREKLDAWIEGYLGYLGDVRRLTARSVADARCTLKRVDGFMAGYRPGLPLWKRPLEDYLAWLSHSRDAGYRDSVLAKDLSHVRGLLEYSWRSGRGERNVLDGFELNTHAPVQEARVLTLDEAQRLVQAYGRQSAAERRSRLIVLILYGCGLRTAELCALDVADIQIERQEIFVRHGKGGYPREVPVPGAVWMELLAYLSERGGKRGALFRTQIKERRISARDVLATVQEAARRAGIDGSVHPKTLRHSFGSHLMIRGVDVGVISVLMGHRSPHETSVYLHILPGQKEQAVAKLTVGEVRP
jgi:site-specific recombinase XerD